MYCTYCCIPNKHIPNNPNKQYRYWSLFTQRVIICGHFPKVFLDPGCFTLDSGLCHWRVSQPPCLRSVCSVGLLDLGLNPACTLRSCLIFTVTIPVGNLIAGSLLLLMAVGWSQGTFICPWHRLCWPLIFNPLICGHLTFLLLSFWERHPS